jgi:hypothetical protein
MKYIFSLSIIIYCYTKSYSQILITTINQIIIEQGEILVDVNDDGADDFKFEFLDLTQGNNAVRVVTLGGAYLDNSTFGYPDALLDGMPVQGNFEYFSGGILGTDVVGGGLFSGAGNRYLGIFIGIPPDIYTEGYYGWIEMCCSANNDTLKIISSGLNTMINAPINAGQRIQINTALNNLQNNYAVEIYPNPVKNQLNISYDKSIFTDFEIYNSTGKIILNGKLNERIDISSLSGGIYYIRMIGNKGLEVFKFLKQ